MSNPFENLSWTCHVCKETRPDDKISVKTSPIVVNGVEIGQQNVRYCNDRQECIEKSKTFSFLKEE